MIVSAIILRYLLPSPLDQYDHMILTGHDFASWDVMASVPPIKARHHISLCKSLLDKQSLSIVVLDQDIRGVGCETFVDVLGHGR